MRVHNFYPVIDHLGVWKHLWLEIIYIFWKGGSKVQVLGQGDAFNSAPNGLNDLKFCMVGAFMGYYWVLVNSSSCNLYKGQTSSGLQMWLASKKSFGPLGTELQPPSYSSLLTLLFPFSFTCLFEIVSAGSNSLFPELSEQKELSDQLSMSESIKMESANQSQADNQDNLNSACKENYTYFRKLHIFHNLLCVPLPLFLSVAVHKLVFEPLFW